MQKKQLRNLRRNTSKIQKMSGDKKEKKEPSGGENYQEGLQQENYLGGQIKSTIRNTGRDQKEIGGEGGKARGQRTMEIIKKEQEKIDVMRAPKRK